MLELQAFGPVDLRTDDGDVGAVLTQPKRLALLLYLALARPQRFQRRDALLALFWPELDEARARNALSQSLSFLRRGLPAGLLQTRGAEEVGVDPAGLRCDVLDFERALEAQRWAEALDLYRGELLAGFHVADAPGFESWLELERERLRELAAGAAWSLARQRIAGAELMLAERAGQQALRLVPTDESAVREFIRALAGAGDRAAALRFYEKFKGILAEELEVEPAPETAAVVAAIRAGDIGPAPSSGEAATGMARVPAANGTTGEAASAPSAPTSTAAPIRRVRRTGWLKVAVGISLIAVV
ncbi:MAG TPA: BTAD domain-containing putative transcriptional regulator, partial [Longimicrobiales bacterium]